MDARLLTDAITFLIREGHTVEVAEGVPGLFNVDGRETTINQVIHLASTEALK